MCGADPQPIGDLVACQLGSLLGQEAADPDRRRHLAVGHVVGDVARRPPLDRVVEVRLGNLADRRLEDGRAFAVFVDQLAPVAASILAMVNRSDGAAIPDVDGSRPAFGRPLVGSDLLVGQRIGAAGLSGGGGEDHPQHVAL